MSGRRVRAIARKDLRDAWRDGRIALLLVLPLAVGILTAKLNGPLPEPVAAASAADAVGPIFASLFSLVIAVAFVATMVVPIQLADELETDTFSALRLAASEPEILAAKALAGCIYAAVSSVLIVALTGLHVDAPVQFAAAAAGLIVTMVAFGLLLALLVPNAGALNTYAGFLVAPLLAVAGAAFAVDSGIIGTVLDLLPISQAVRLLADAASSSPALDTGPGSWLVIAAWTVGGYWALARIASRRER
jgi:hypothetical protein